LQPITKMTKIICCIIVFVISFQPIFCSAADGVDGTASVRKSNPLVEQYVNEATMKMVVFTYGHIFDEAIKKQNMQIVPQIAYLAAQHAAAESLDEPNLKEIIRQAYDQGLEIAYSERDRGTQPAIIEQMVRETIKQELRRMIDLMEFHFITEQELRQAIMKQQQIMIAQAYQQQMQKLVIEQQLMEQMIQKQYQQAVQTSILK